MFHDNSDTDEDARDAALAWIARFRSDSATDQDRAEFSLWLRQAPANKIAMDSMLDMWADLALVKQLYSENEATAATKSANNSRWLGIGAATAACFAAALVLWPTSTQLADPLRFETAVGEQRTIELEDSSTLVLNTNSRVTVRYNDERRSLKLLSGEVYFSVAKDADRPFSVDAGSAIVTAVGTAFNIHREGEHTRVAVTEGVVQVAQAVTVGVKPAATELLHASQQLNAGPAGLDAASTADLDITLAWQRGELVARNMTLLDLTKEIGRYHDINLLLADARVASLTVSGVFEIADLDPVLEAVQLTLGLEVVTIDAKTLLLLKPPQ